MNIGVLCGQELPHLMKNPEQLRVDTPYGAVVVHASKLAKHTLYFLRRHGEQSNLPPHRVNHLGNIQALASCHVTSIFSVGTVGSMKEAIRPGDLVIPHDFIDATKARPLTFFDDRRVHVDMTEPFCTVLRDAVIGACEETKEISFHRTGVYLVTEGPRLETAAEIKWYSTIADVVGMTLVPEVVLAREKGICFVSLCLVCNMAAGLQERLSIDEIASVYKKKEPVLSRILRSAILSVDESLPCGCPGDVSKATL
jgi:5'-methylthioadenosine phosphorylase